MNTAIYNFASAPITFDFAVFLATSRLFFAKNTGVPEFSVELDARVWRNHTPREREYSLDDRLWRLHNLIMPIIGTAPGITGLALRHFPDSKGDLEPGRVRFCAEEDWYLTSGLRRIFESFPYDPHLYLAPQRAVDIAAELLKVSEGKPTAVLAARQSAFEPQRDSREQTLIEAANVLCGEGFSVFIIPDQESPSWKVNRREKVRLLKEASFNLPLRLALYELADVVICPASGPTSYASLGIRKPNMLIYNPIHLNMRTASAEWHKATGLDVGAKQPFPWTPENQIWLWDIEPSGESLANAAIDLVARLND